MQVIQLADGRMWDKRSLFLRGIELERALVGDHSESICLQIETSESQKILQDMVMRNK